MLRIFLITWLLVSGASQLIELGAKPPQPATASSKVAAAPSHPVLAERFHFHEKLSDHWQHEARQSKKASTDKAATKSFNGLPSIAEDLVNLLHTSRLWPLVRAISSLSVTDMLDGPPVELEKTYTFEDAPLGTGSFGQVWKATDKESGDIVVIKVMTLPGFPFGATYKQALDFGPAAMNMLELSSTECQTAIDIQSQDEAHEESQWVVKCREDGIALAKVDQDRPIYLVLDYAGSSTLDKWAQQSLGERKNIVKNLAQMRRLVSQMMRALQYMTKEDHAVKFVHHDLKPENVAVNDENEFSNARVIDLGTALRSDIPDGKSHCTMLFRPPETGTTGVDAGQVGAVEPWHSYDTYGAAASIIAMVAGVQMQGKLLPALQIRAVLEGQAASVTPRLLPMVADCVNRLAASNTRGLGLLDMVGQCLTEVPNKPQMEYVASVLKSVTRTNAETSPAKFYQGISCMMPIGITGNAQAGEAFVPVLEGDSDREQTWQRVMTEWYDTGFAGVLAKMMDPDPGQRPTPEDVLANPWLQPNYLCSGEVEGWCLEPDLEPAQTWDHAGLRDSCREIKVPMSALLDSLGHLITILVLIPMSCCCCCCGFCPQPYDFGFLTCAAFLLLICSVPAALLWVDIGMGLVVLLYLCAFGLTGGLIYSMYSQKAFFGHMAVAVAFHAFVFFIYVNVLLRPSIKLVSAMSAAADSPAAINSPSADDPNQAAVERQQERALIDIANYTKVLLYLCVVVPITEFFVSLVMAYKAYLSHGLLGKKGSGPNISNPTEPLTVATAQVAPVAQAIEMSEQNRHAW